jgi:hypothetical protein
MNKRTTKKWLKKSRVPKHLLRLAAKYSVVHNEYDEHGAVGEYRLVGRSECFDNLKFFDIMPPKSKEKIHRLCEELFLATSKIVGIDESPQYENGMLEHQCNYRIVRKTEGEYVPCFVERNGEEYEVQGYYVSQVTKFEDNYEGTIYLPLNNSKFLAYDYVM